MNCKNCGTYNEVTVDNIPAMYKPMSAWSYFGHSILFSIPVVGFILLIVFSFKRGNINKRNFARSYFCGLILVAVLFAVLIATGVGAGILSELSF